VFCKVRYIVLITVVLLNACTTVLEKHTGGNTVFWEIRSPELKKITTWLADGQISSRQGKQSGTLTMLWSKNESVHNVSILAPFGQKVLNLTTDQYSTRLVLQDGRVINGRDPQVLIKEITKLEVPIEQLKLWILGRTTPNRKNEFNKDGLLLASSIDGWELSIKEYIEVESLKHGITQMPSLIKIKKGDVHIVLRIGSWNIDSDEANITFEDSVLIPLFR